jgi:hypothetical protein
MPPERIVRFRPRVILTMAALIVGVGARPVGGMGVAPRPGLDARVGVPGAGVEPGRRGLQCGACVSASPAGAVYLLVIATITGIGALVVPTLVQQVNELVDAAPGYVRDLTAG